MNQIEPSPSIIDACVDQLVVPKLNNLARDTERKINANIELFVNDIGKPYRQINIGDFKQPMDIDLRIRFREAYGGRYIMFCEALIGEAQSVSGCSGFMLKGDMRIDRQPKCTSHTIRYNLWHWVGWR